MGKFIPNASEDLKERAREHNPNALIDLMLLGDPQRYMD